MVRELLIFMLVLCLGTIMAANVFRVIIPAQKNWLMAAENNSNPDLNLS